MRARKWVAVAASGLVLGLQILVMPPRGPFSGTWYWPFTNYTMYAYASHEGDTVTVRRLLAVPCDPADGSLELTHGDLRGWPSWFQFQLERIEAEGDVEAARGRRRAITIIEDRIARYFPDDFCSGELWVKTMRLSRDLSRARSVPWVLAHRWRLADPKSGADGDNGPHGETP